MDTCHEEASFPGDECGEPHAAEPESSSLRVMGAACTGDIALMKCSLQVLSVSDEISKRDCLSVGNGLVWEGRT